MARRKKNTIVYSDEEFSVIRIKSRGWNRPAYFRIEALVDKQCDNRLDHRRIELTVDELFYLTDILDDLCDRLEEERDAEASLSDG